MIAVFAGHREDFPIDVFVAGPPPHVRSGPELKSPNFSRGMFSYPDVVVICGEPVYHDEHHDVVLNPTAIVEALSPSTEAFDRGEKFVRYQTWNPTLKDYLLVSQDKQQVEHYNRQTNGSWSYHLHTTLDTVVAILSIQCALAFADIYDRVVFPQE